MFQAHRTLVVHIAYKYSRTLPPQLQSIWPCVYHTTPMWSQFRDSSWPAGICPKGIRLVDHNILHTPSQRWYLLYSRWCMERLWPWSQPEVTDGWRHKKTLALICLDLLKTFWSYDSIYSNPVNYHFKYHFKYILCVHYVCCIIKMCETAKCDIKWAHPQAAAARIWLHASRRRSVASPEIRRKATFALKTPRKLRCLFFVWCIILY